MKSETKGWTTFFCIVIALSLFLSAPGLIYGLKYKALEKDYRLLQEQNFELIYDTYEEIIYYEKELKEFETWGEEASLKLAEYERLKGKYETLFDKYEALLIDQAFDIRQLISDYDDTIEYYIYWQSYAERNPDVTFEQFVKMKNPKLWERLMEYSNY